MLKIRKRTVCAVLVPRSVHIIEGLRLVSPVRRHFDGTVSLRIQGITRRVYRESSPGIFFRASRLKVNKGTHEFSTTTPDTEYWKTNRYCLRGSATDEHIRGSWDSEYTELTEKFCTLRWSVYTKAAEYVAEGVCAASPYVWTSHKGTVVKVPLLKRPLSKKRDCGYRKVWIGPRLS